MFKDATDALHLSANWELAFETPRCSAMAKAVAIFAATQAVSISDAQKRYLVAKNVVKTYSVFLADGTVPEFLKVRVVEAASGPAAPPAAEPAPLEL